MAIIKLGALVAGIRGTVGGVTFSGGAGGATARLWSRGSNPRTALQTSHRSVISGMPPPWRAMTVAQKTAWGTYAAAAPQQKFNSLGVGYFASGWNWFVAVNAALMQSGDAVTITPPAAGVPAAPAITGINTNFAGGLPHVVLIYPAGIYAPNFRLVVFGAFIPGAGREVQYSGYNLLLATASPGVATQDVSAEFIARYGQANVGDRLFLQVYKQTVDGRRSAPSAYWSDFF